MVSEKFTTDDKLDLLFDPELISSDVKEALADGFHIRPLSTTDYKRSHLELLSVLTVAPVISEEVYADVVGDMKLRGRRGGYFPVVIVQHETDQLVATGTLLIERKFLRNAGLVGHIEDIAVSKDLQGKKLGLRIIQALTGLAESQGCYKTILDCNKDNIPFYEKCGFEHKEYEMAIVAETLGMQRSTSFSVTRPIRRRRSSIKRSKSLQKSCHSVLEEDFLLQPQEPFPMEVPMHPGSSFLSGSKLTEADCEVDLATKESVVPTDMSTMVATSSQTHLNRPATTASLDMKEEHLPIECNSGSIELTVGSITEALREKPPVEVSVSTSATGTLSPRKVQPDEQTLQPIIQSPTSSSPNAIDFEELTALDKGVAKTDSAHISVLPNDSELFEHDRPIRLADDVLSTTFSDQTYEFKHISDSKVPALTENPVVGSNNEVSVKNSQHHTVHATPLDNHHEFSFVDKPKEDPSVETGQVSPSVINSQLSERPVSMSGFPSPIETAQNDSDIREGKIDLSATHLEIDEQHELVDQPGNIPGETHVTSEEVFEEFLEGTELTPEVLIREGQDLICFSPGATVLNSPQCNTLVDIGFEGAQRDDIITLKDLDADQRVIGELCSDEESDSDHSVQDEIPTRSIGRFSALIPTNIPLLTETDGSISLTWPNNQDKDRPSVHSQEVEPHDQLITSSPVLKKRKISTPLDRNPMAIKKLKQPFKCPLITEKTSDKLTAPISSQPTASSPISSSPTPLPELRPMLAQRSRPLSFKPLTIRPTVQYKALRDKLGLCSTSNNQDVRSIPDHSPASKDSDPELEVRSRSMSKRNPFVTLKASAPFVSPVTTSSSILAEGTSSSIGCAGKVTQREVAKLESKVQIIKQAIRLVQGEGRRQEEKQEELILKWKDAGREISQLLWDEGGSDNPADNFQSLEPNPFSSSPPASSLFPSDAFSPFPRQSFFSNSIFSDRPLLSTVDDSANDHGEFLERERSLSLDSSIGSPSAYRPSRSGGSGLGMSARRQLG
ncbi:Glucosamine-phosphate N-acetyltransferase [Phaffia rhodozyma]|uniref:Glucosamine-phosphate N-acetyltransferase n=1 Tax=Phaffia rhodozyma TaxID=264483 RepID=A0A0F7SLP8_PHARH|nr:Glucosamine-phosphate N-acetyltransferase [Phaffia rhodozyma]